MASPLISTARMERKLRAILGVLGSDILPDLDAISPFLVLESDRPEWRFAGGEWLWGFNALQAAGGAGQFSRAGAANPAGSEMLVIVTRTHLLGAAAARARFGILTTPTPGEISSTGAFTMRRDSRIKTTEQPTVRRNLAQSAIQQFGANDALFELLPGSAAPSVPWPESVILSPGHALVGEPTAANTGIEVVYSGYQVPLEHSLLG